MPLFRSSYVLPSESFIYLFILREPRQVTFIQEGKKEKKNSGAINCNNTETQGRFSHIPPDSDSI